MDMYIFLGGGGTWPRAEITWSHCPALLSSNQTASPQPWVHFLFKFDLVFHSSSNSSGFPRGLPTWGTWGTDRLWQLIKKVVPHSFFIAVVYRAAWLSDCIFIWSFPLFILSPFFYCRAFIPPKCFDKFPWKVGRGPFPLGSWTIYVVSFVIWFMACLGEMRSDMGAL